MDTMEYLITTEDDVFCGVRITPTSDGYNLEGIETGKKIAHADTPLEAIVAAGKYLMTYRDDALRTYTDWSVTYRQGQEMVTSPDGFVELLEWETK